MEDNLESRMVAELAEIGRTRMPFGKYGPSRYPPGGLPIYDLPEEYLLWFKKKGDFPKGRLGHLLQVVCQMKTDGSDSAFNVLRNQSKS